MKCSSYDGSGCFATWCWLPPGAVFPHYPPPVSTPTPTFPSSVADVSCEPLHIYRQGLQPPADSREHLSSSILQWSAWFMVKHLTSKHRIKRTWLQRRFWFPSQNQTNGKILFAIKLDIVMAICSDKNVLKLFSWVNHNIFSSECVRLIFS